MPSSSRRQPTRACSTVGTATLTASTRPASDSMSGKTSVENSCATCAARAAFASTMPTSSASGKLAIHAGMVPAEIPRTDDGDTDFSSGFATEFS